MMNRPVSIIDGHSDFLLSLADTGRDFFSESEVGHVDLPRLRRGGIGAIMAAVYVRNEDIPGQALIQTLRGTDRLHRLVAESGGQMELVRSYRQLLDCLERGVFGAILHWEGAEAIDPELVVLRLGYVLGLRSLGLVWSRTNIFAEGVGPENRGGGLSPLGKLLVGQCNELGVLIDVSHLNVPGFWDVLETSTKPIVASHSNAFAVTDHERNLTDLQLKELAAGGGLAGLNYAVGFLKRGAKQPGDVTLDDMVAHIDHMVEVAGIDHVALGSDYDGATVPEAVRDAARDSLLIEELAKRGYDDEAIRKIARDNWLRVLGEVWGA